MVDKKKGYESEEEMPSLLRSLLILPVNNHIAMVNIEFIVFEVVKIF